MTLTNIDDMDKDKLRLYKQDLIDDIKENRRLYNQFCSDCPKAYDFTCSGINAINCEREKSKLLDAIKLDIEVLKLIELKESSEQEDLIVSDDKKKYYNFQDILNFLSFDYKFETKSYGYPFTRKREDVTFSWGQILIPKEGIREMVQNKISDVKEQPLEELVMMYQLPFMVKDKHGFKTGMINQDISLSFRYDKTYKYGDINKSIYECCFYILEHATETNHFYILTDENLFTFFSYYIIENQWGLGATTVSSPCNEKYFIPKNPYQDGCVNCCHLDTGDKCTLETECVNCSKFSYGDEKTEDNENKLTNISNDLVQRSKLIGEVLKAMRTVPKDVFDYGCNQGIMEAITRVRHFLDFTPEEVCKDISVFKKLKPCPSCGTANEFVFNGCTPQGTNTPQFYIFCSHCGHFTGYGSAEDVIRKWNGGDD